MNKIIITIRHLSAFLAVGSALSCTTPAAKDVVLSADTQRMDSRGCMISPSAPKAPQKPSTTASSYAAESYYEKLEYYFLLSAENCLSSKERCEELSAVLEKIPARLLSSASASGDIELSNTIRHSNNKIAAMVAVNLYAIEKRHKISFPAQPWLKKLLKANDLTTSTEELTVSGETQKYSFAAHNMAAASARAHVFLGVFTKDQELINQGLAQIPKILESRREDGSLPLETRRGARALRYSMQVLSDLVAMIHLAPTQKSLYDQYKKDILHLADFDIKALQNTALLNTYAQQNLSPGPIADHKLQDISSLRSRLAWVVVLNSMEPGYLDKIEDLEIDKRSCAHVHLKKKVECSPLMNTISDVVSSPLGFTLGYSPKCAAL